MRDFATTGFLSNAKRSITFSIPLDKPAIADEVYFSSMNVQVRHINGGFLINEDVMLGDYTVVSNLKGMSIEVVITRAEPFDTLNDIPLSVYVVEANGQFYSAEMPKPEVHEKTHEELMEELLKVWGTEGENNEGESDTGSEQLHSDTEESV